jgi:hypothetical protein
MWSADTTKAAFLGVTAHWIEVKNEKWEMRSEVIGFRSVSGDHGGENLGRYFVGVCDRIGMTSKVNQTLSNCYLITDTFNSCTLSHSTMPQATTHFAKLLKLPSDDGTFLCGRRRRTNSRNVPIVDLFNVVV